MDLTEKETQRLEKLIKWSENKSRNILIGSLVVLMICVIVGCGISAVFGVIDWKEFAWLAFLFMALVVWVKAVYDTESNLKFVLKICKRQREIIQDLSSKDSKSQ